MKLCNKECFPTCEFCKYLIFEADYKTPLESAIESSCELGKEIYHQAENDICEYFECFLYDREERRHTRFEISKEDYKNSEYY